MAAAPIQWNIYQFRAHGRDYVYCAESLFLFEVDRLTATILQMSQSRTRTEILLELAPLYSAAKVRKVFGELDRLSRSGILTPGGRRRPQASKLDFDPDNPSFSDLWLILTHNCNMGCKYCFSAAEYMHGNRSMSWEVAQRAVDFLLAHSEGENKLSLVFFGGEPLLNFAVMRDTVKYARDSMAETGKDLNFAITTNGTMLTPAIRRYLLKHNFHTMISFDGPEAMHNAARCFKDGRGSYAAIAPQVKAFVAEAAGAGTPVQGRATLNRHHLGHLLELYEFMEREMGFPGISTPIIHRPAPPEFCFAASDLPQLAGEVRQLGEHVLAKLTPQGKFPPYGFFTFLYLLHRRVRADRGCAAGRSAITVDTNGDIFPCERFIDCPDYRLGNVVTGEFQTTPAIRLSSLDHICAYPKCSSCYALMFCKSTCVAERVRYLGPEGPTEVDCEIYRLLLREMLRLYVSLPQGDFLE